MLFLPLPSSNRRLLANASFYLRSLVLLLSFFALASSTLLLEGCSSDLSGSSIPANSVPASSSGQTLAMSAVLPTGSVGVAYSATVTVTGGRAPYHFSLPSGELPSGTQLGPGTGTISGKPSASGSFDFAISVSDSSGSSKQQSFQIQISSGAIVSVSVTPETVNVPSGGSVRFSVLVGNSSNRAVTWAATTGTISNNGVYTAPDVIANTPGKVTATALADPTESASAIVTILGPPPPVTISVSPTSITLVSGASTQFSASITNDSNETVTWSATQGIISASGLYTAPQVNTETTASLTATSVAVPTKSASATVTITPLPDPDNIYCGIGNVPLGPTSDGPALLPLSCINSSLANTPSPGTVVPLAAGGDLQAAYNALQCGQTLALAHGATWEGPYQFTPKNCDDQHWITIMSDGSLTAPENRIDPTYLPQLAAISLKQFHPPTNVSGDHLRFIGIAWLKEPGKALVDMVAVSGAVKVVFDRNYAHGNPGEETRRFLTLNGGNYIAVVESVVDEMHCLSPGSCTDAQAISGGGHGSTPEGTFKIVNNSLSAATENILFGGGPATVTPCDIEIRSNYLYKPLTWNPSDPTYAGTKYDVKNLFEMKNACRVLLEGNVLANTWAGFSQRGWAFVIGPKNQDDGGVSVCPLCFIDNVVVRYNWITTAAGIFAIDVGMTKSGGWAASAGHYSVHDDLADNLQYPACYGCGRNLSEFSSGYSTTNPPPPTDVLNNIALNHLTIVTAPAWPSGIKDETAMIEMGGPPAGNPTSTPQMSDITYENSISSAGMSGFYSTGGGSENCVVGEKTLADIIPACWTDGSMFSGNVIVAYGGKSTWPEGNLFAPNWAGVGFVNYNNGNGGNYTLSDASPFKGKALDGSDPGANIDLVMQYTQTSITGIPNTTLPAVSAVLSAGK
jgi:putative Ig domain-containing protein